MSRCEGSAQPIGLVYQPDYLKHRGPRWHPERPEGLSVILEHLAGGYALRAEVLRAFLREH